MHDEFNEYDEYDEYDQFNIIDSDLDVFDKKEIEFYEVSCYEWVCEECSSINIERRKPRFGKFVHCRECNEVFSSVFCEE